MSNAIEFGLGYDLKGLQTGGAQAQAMVNRTMSGLGKSAGLAAAGFNKLAPYLGGAAIAGGVKTLVDFGSSITDLSEAAGLSTDTFQQWSFALEQNGARQEDLVKTMGALIGKQQDAADGNEKTIASFERMGISLADLKRSSPEQLLLRMSDALKRSGGDGETTAAMMDILGNKISLKLLPALKGGSEAFLELANSASIASAESIKKMDDLGDAFDARVRSMKVTAMGAFVDMGSLIDKFKGDRTSMLDGIIQFFSPSVADVARPKQDDMIPFGNEPEDRSVDDALAARNFAAPTGPWDRFKNFKTGGHPGGGLQGATMAGGLSSAIFSGGGALNPMGFFSDLLAGSGEGGLSNGAQKLIRKGDKARGEAEAARKAKEENAAAAKSTADNTKWILETMQNVWEKKK